MTTLGHVAAAEQKGNAALPSLGQVGCADDISVLRIYDRNTTPYKIVSELRVSFLF